MTDRELMRRTWEFFSHYILVNEMAQERLDAEAETILEALRARLAQPEQPQIVWIDNKQTGNFMNIAPPQREWQGLTEAERIDIIDEEITAQSTEHFALAQAIEAKLKEKNNG